MKIPWAVVLLAALASASWAQTPAPQDVPPTGTTPAPSQSPPENVGKPIGDPDAGFDPLDGNHDGRLSKTEAKASTELTTRFAEFDTNGDGYLSRPEYEAFGREPSRGVAVPPRQR